jgi:CBS-domain-containing membrane protein
MFAVYGLQGRMFSGTLDRVRELGPVQAVARARALAGVEQQDQAPLAAVVAGQSGDASGFAGLAAEGRPLQALSAYAQTAAAPRQPLTLVQQLMSRKLVTVPLAASVREAWGLLAQAGVGQAPVLDPAGHLVGLIMRADLLRPDSLPLDPADAPAWTARLAQPVARVMWTPVPTAQPETPVREVAQLLLDLHLPGLPVLDEQGALQGFLSRSDLLRALTHEPPLDLWS